jgi:hypothetical protein
MYRWATYLGILFERVVGSSRWAIYINFSEGDVCRWP